MVRQTTNKRKKRDRDTHFDNAAFRAVQDHVAQVREQYGDGKLTPSLMETTAGYKKPEQSEPIYGEEEEGKGSIDVFLSGSAV